MKLKQYFSAGTLLLFFFMGSHQVQAEYSSMLAPTDYTPGSYIAPKYDPFDKHSPALDLLLEDEIDPAPVADFTFYTNQKGLPRVNAGTTTTEFVFDASVSTDFSLNGNTYGNALEVRWDFENDGKVDSHFSKIKSIRHIFKKAGTYNVKLEVLDRAGNISTATKTVLIAQNTPPFAHFFYTPVSGTEKKVFTFDTRLSKDDQYLTQSLKYRFDWNGDGKWDTPYDSKTSWYHRFDDVGQHTVFMEVKDPEGAIATSSTNITTFPNTPPKAAFTVRTIGTQGGTTYEFDASLSTDAQTPHHRLQYRFDTDFHGKDDIVTNTYFAFSDRYSGVYTIPGEKIIRLEVRDEDSTISYAYARIHVAEDDVIVMPLQEYVSPQPSF